MIKPLILLVLILLIPVCDALACSCGLTPSPSQAYQEADAVFVGVVKKIEPELSEEKARYGEQTGYVEVEKGFKKAKGGDEFVFHQPNPICAPKYQPGNRCLFYANIHPDTKAWVVYGCGRSRSADWAHDDLLYLEHRPELTRQTRISGTLEHYEDAPQKGFTHINNLAGVKVVIASEKKSVELYTDQNGVFEMAGLPEGKYWIRPEIPYGLKVRSPMAFGAVSDVDDYAVRVQLKIGNCAGSDFVLSSDAVVSGRVIGTDGQPIPNVSLDLIPAGISTVSPYFRLYSYTKSEGQFWIEKVPPGKYLIVVNKEGKRNGYTSFPATYYPGVFEKDKATVITISLGQPPGEFDILIPSQSPTILLEGMLLFSDGRPVADESAKFSADVSKPENEDTAYSQTDSQGHFSLRLLQGVAGKLTRELNAYSGMFENCPVVEKLIKAQGGGLVNVETERLRVEAKTDVQDVKLILPLAFCKKKKD